MTTNLLLRLDVQRLRNTFNHYRTDPKDARRIFFFVLGIGFFLWWNVLRHVVAKKTGFLVAWPYLRYGFPMLFASLAAAIGAYGRVSKWLARWSAGSWSVLPLEPKHITLWLLSSMLLMDSGWLAIAIALSIGLSFVTGLVWWQEFPFLLAGTALLIAMASVAKIFASLLLRLGNERVLLWQNWILRFLGSLIAATLLQPLSALWLFAEYQRQNGNPGAATLVLLVLAGLVVGLALLARLLLLRNWSGIAASFEVQQTTRRADDSVPIARFIAGRMRFPVARFVALYNLRSGIQLARFGQPVMVGGRRLYMLLAFLPFVGLLLVAFCAMAIKDHEPMAAAIGGAFWAAMFSTVLVPPVGPAYRFLRMLPVSFHDWLRALCTLPLVAAAVIGVGCSVAIALADPSGAYVWYGVLFGIILGAVPLRAFVVSAFPDAQQTGEFVYVISLGLGVLAYFALGWMSVVPVMLALNIFFYRKAAREWRCREEGLSV